MSIKKKIIIRIAIGALSVFMLLFGVLVYHLYQVTHKPGYGDVGLQMARIDFKQPLDSLQANNARNIVATLPGIKYAFINKESGMLVYSYAANQQNSLNVYNTLISKVNYKAERYVVSTEQSKTGCPILDDKNSFSSKLTKLIAKL